MDLEYGVRKWPQPSNYRPNLEILSSHSHSRPLPVKPLDPKYYQRYATVKAVQEALEKDLEVAAAKVAKAEADLSVADAALAENKWSKAASKMSNSQRLKNLLAEAKAAEAIVRGKLDAYTKENSALIDIIRLQENMEKTYQDVMSY